MPSFTGSIKSDPIALRNIRNLRNLRKKMGLTINFVASRIGISSTALGNYELYPEACTPAGYALIAKFFNFEPFDPFRHLNNSEQMNADSQTQNSNNQELSLPLDNDDFSLKLLTDVIEKNTATNLKLIDALRNVYSLLDKAIKACSREAGEA